MSSTACCKSFYCSFLLCIGVVNVIDVANVVYAADAVDAVRCIYFWLTLAIDFKGFYDAVSVYQYPTMNVICLLAGFILKLKNQMR